MKINIQRTAKCIASFMGIALALVLCVTPAFAAEDGIYRPADYEVGKPVTDAHGVITYHYSFGVTPLVRTYFTDIFDSELYTSEFEIIPPSGVQKTAVRVFPLGVYGNTNSPWPVGRGVVDVRDFKAYSQFDLAATFDVSVTWPSPNNGTLSVRHYWFVQCYDDTGYPTGLIKSQTFDESFNINNSGAGGHSITCGGVIQLPENTAYILPSVYLVLYAPPASGNHRYIVRTTDLYMSFSIDSVLENTQTMQTMKDQLQQMNDKLDDTNEKLDDILNGSPEDNQTAADSSQNVENKVNDYYSIMRELEQYEKIESQWGVEVLANFLNSDAYWKFQDLLSPLLNWPSYSTLMLTILALVNLSIILFGR